ncbi:MAG: aspartate aminotransferase family protein [Acidimicrobiia bacterium]|mgnify:CR=1 FL=1|nr:aspartate aminotransferase family protein [Acidimicrobiia bacterium]
MTKDLHTKAKEITESELKTYEERTKESSRHTHEAQKVLPMGVPSSFQFYDPHPVVASKAQASWLEDVDGNHYVDFNMGYGALLAGHCHPVLKKAIIEQLELGTLFVTPCDTNADVASLLCERFSQDMFRFTNSGTESTHDALRVARGHTGRSKIIKLEGGYHGHHDEVMVSTKPALVEAGDPNFPNTIPATGGLPDGVVTDVTIVPFNNLESLETLLKTKEYAAFILEPAMENIGIVLPDDGYLQGVRDLTKKYGTVLIFDEVKTGITSGYNGATGVFGVIPDMVCLAKSIGGGLPLGAFGGSHELMDNISNGKVQHLGTYNGNPLVMAAARAVLGDICTKENIDEASRKNRSILDRIDAIIAQYDLPAHTVQLGAKGCITWSRDRVRNYRDYKATDFELAYAQWVWGINRGILLPPGLDEQWLISVQTTEEDCDQLVDVFKTFVEELVS